MMVCLEGLKGNKHLFCFCPLPPLSIEEETFMTPSLMHSIQNGFYNGFNHFLFCFSISSIFSPLNWFLIHQASLYLSVLPKVSVLHTVPNLHFWFKNSTFWKICSDVIFSFCIGFDGRFEIKMPKKLMNFEFLPQNCSKLNFLKFIFGSKPRFFARKIQFLVKLAWNIQEYLPILTQKFKYFRN